VTDNILALINSKDFQGNKIKKNHPLGSIIIISDQFVRVLSNSGTLAFLVGGEKKPTPNTSKESRR
jgi:hypothetical protein